MRKTSQLSKQSVKRSTWTTKIRSSLKRGQLVDMLYWQDQSVGKINKKKEKEKENSISEKKNFRNVKKKKV